MRQLLTYKHNTMSFKNISLFAFIGTLTLVAEALFYLLLNMQVIEVESWNAESWKTFYIATGIISLFGYGSLALFFFTLFKRQK